MSINQAFSSLKNINSFSKAWNEEIIKSIPSENLLILDVKEEEKWGKLCTRVGHSGSHYVAPLIHDRYSPDVSKNSIG